MKKIICALLIMTMLVSAGNVCALAEGSGNYTADELAYVAYLDIGSVYNSCLQYLNRLNGLWESLLNVKTFDDIDSGWLLEYRAANMDTTESMQRNLFLTRLGRAKFGVEDTNAFLNGTAFVDAIKTEAAARGMTDPRSTIWIVLGWAEESGQLASKEVLENGLKNGMDVIRMIMSLDSNYVNLNTLKNYYKDASQLHNYVADFSDNYLDFQDKLKQFQEEYDSWEIEFDFALGTDAYKSYGDAYLKFISERN